jgi:hypothetical protein
MRGGGGGPLITVENFAGAPRLPISRNPYGAISLTASTSPVTTSTNAARKIKHIDKIRIEPATGLSADQIPHQYGAISFQLTILGVVAA